MRYLIPAFAILVLAAACGSGDAARSSHSPTPMKPVPTLDRTPSLLSDVPEGRIIIASGSSGKGYSLAGELAEEIPGGDVFRSPDGARAVLIRRTGPGSFDAIGVLEGSEVRIIHEWDASWYPAVAWDQDGSRFAYSVSPDPWSADALVVIWIADADGAGRRKLISAPGAYPLGWAADGRLVAGSATSWLSLIDDGALATAIPPVPEDESLDTSLSPDGRLIAAQAGYVEEQPDAQYLRFTGLWVYDIGAGTWSKVAEMSMSVRRPTAFVSANVSLALARKGPPPLSWSPDGKHVAFTKSSTGQDGADYMWELWLAHIEDGTSERLAANAYQAVWSADSRFVSFTLDAIKADGGAAYHRRGGETQIISAEGNGPATSTAWASDGRLIISFAQAIKIVDPDTGHATEALDESGGSVSGAHIWGKDQAWSPSGRYVAFSALGTTFMLDLETAVVRALIGSGGYYAVAWLAE